MNINMPQLEKAGNWNFVGQILDEVQLNSLIEIGDYCFVQCSFNQDIAFDSLTEIGKGSFAGSKVNANLYFEKLTNIPKNFAFGVQIKKGNYIRIGDAKFTSFDELLSNFDYDQTEFNNDIQNQKNKK